MDKKIVTKLKMWSAISVVIGCVIGSGVFVKPGRVLMNAGDSSSALLAWLLGGLITLAGGLTVAEIASRIPKTGGVYTYIQELYGREVGFMCGWIQTVVYGPGLMAALSLYFASLFTQFFQMGDVYVKPVALMTIFFIASVTVLGTKYSAWIQNSTTFVKLLPIFGIGLFGLVSGNETIFGMELSQPVAAAGMGAAVLSTLWAYDGWMQVSNVAGEIENPSKNLPRAIIIGLSVVMAVYLLVNLALFHTLDVQQIAALNEKAAGKASEILFGSLGGKLLSLGILISIFGSLNGNTFTMTRVPYAIALKDPFPFKEKFASLHPQFGTPVHSIVLKVVAATTMILLMNPDRITDLAIFSMYIFYGMCFFGIFKIRKQFGVPAKGSYRVPLYPIVPLVAIGGCLFICQGMLQQSPWDGLLSLSIAALGYPIYKWLDRQNKEEGLKVALATVPLKVDGNNK